MSKSGFDEVQGSSLYELAIRSALHPPYSSDVGPCDISLLLDLNVLAGCKEVLFERDGRSGAVNNSFEE